jgi:hypothetical protein
MGTHGELAPYQGSVLAIDPAGRGADETAYAVVKMLNSQLFVAECGGIQGGYSEDVLKSLSMIAKDHKVNEVIIESNFGDGMFNQLLTPVMNKIHRVTISEVRHSKQKEKRIVDTLEPVMNSHKLIVDEAVIKNDYESTKHYTPEKALRYQLFYQMTRITKERGALAHDDRLDVLAIAVNYWVEQMARNVDDAIKDAHNDRLTKGLQKFMDSALGRKSKGNLWINTKF